MEVWKDGDSSPCSRHGQNAQERSDGMRADRRQKTVRMAMITGFVAGLVGLAAPNASAQTHDPTVFINYYTWGALTTGIFTTPGTSLSTTFPPSATATDQLWTTGFNWSSKPFTFEITSVKSQLVVEIGTASLSVGTATVNSPIVQMNPLTGWYQHWTALPVAFDGARGWFVIQSNQDPSLCLLDTGSPGTGGGVIAGYCDANNPRQHWAVWFPTARAWEHTP